MPRHIGRQIGLLLVRIVKGCTAAHADSTQQKNVAWGEMACAARPTMKYGGILPYAVVGGRVAVLLGKEIHEDGWSGSGLWEIVVLTGIQKNAAQTDRLRLAREQTTRMVAAVTMRP